ncbi:hypothetical protein ONS95_014253 [Cadophora gregata]|uniref:uncharacterized protein n=1 Tax=Cadophora gregata TaxID=51156 RepID=UPI0026DC92DF|nr:uncharacterized protein ONS95_014253 [Cadophora gregata]KAK0114010.1 hypothetical protein ONS96_014857 [Cadophora gregata f. sp. sojae]KAK0114770.1 hypothetical protein ONS95_014253 [Cadophora gregata]
MYAWKRLLQLQSPHHGSLSSGQPNSIPMPQNSSLSLWATFDPLVTSKAGKWATTLMDCSLAYVPKDFIGFRSILVLINLNPEVCRSLRAASAPVFDRGSAFQRHARHTGQHRRSHDNNA